MDSTMLSILTITTAAVLRALVSSIAESTAESVDDEGQVGGNGGWRLGKENNILLNEESKQPLGLVR